MPHAGSSPATYHAPPPMEGAALLAAAIGCLQPAIDPMFLTLLSQTAPVPLNSHGLIVGATQAGAALGGLAVWHFDSRLPGRTFSCAAAFATLCSLLTVWAATLPALLLLRGLYGIAMGMVFAHAMTRCAARRPNTAYGGMFLLQLLLATLVSLALPALAHVHGPGTALGLLALAPALACAALLMAGPAQIGGTAQPGTGPKAPVPAAGWALAVATFCIICATMLVWSFAGALATTAGIGDSVIGEAVALGSLVGAATALAVMRERVMMPLPLLLMALIGGLMLTSPLVMIGPGQANAFILSIVLLNIGSTALIIRCSGLASATSRDCRFQTLVACTHSLGMIAGPVAGSILVEELGRTGLFIGVILALTAGLGAILFAVKQGVGAEPMRLQPVPAQTNANMPQSA